MGVVTDTISGGGSGAWNGGLKGVVYGAAIGAVLIGGGAALIAAGGAALMGVEAVGLAAAVAGGLGAVAGAGVGAVKGGIVGVFVGGGVGAYKGATGKNNVTEKSLSTEQQLDLLQTQNAALANIAERQKAASSFNNPDTTTDHVTKATAPTPTQTVSVESNKDGFVARTQTSAPEAAAQR